MQETGGGGALPDRQHRQRCCTSCGQVGFRVYMSRGQEEIAGLPVESCLRFCPACRSDHVACCEWEGMPAACAQVVT